MKKPYPKYKATTLPWLSQVPENWKEVRYKYLFKEINEKSKKGSEDLLSVSQYTGVTLRKDNIEEEKENLTNASSLEGYKKVKENDLVINIMLAWNGSLGISPLEGIASPAYCVYRGYNEILPKYYHYLVRTEYSKGDFKKVSKGVVDSRLRMYTDDFFQLYTLLPPRPEQTKIAAFLDHKCNLIDTAIQKKVRLIALLKEQKQAVINCAVTRGLDPHAPMKDSSIEWLGEIPAHWGLKKLRHITEFIQTGPFGSQLHAAEYIENGIPIINPANIYEGKVIPDWKCCITSEKANDLNRHLLKKGNIIFGRRGEMGRCAIVNEEEEGWLCGTGSIRVSIIHNKVNGDFLSVYLQSAFINGS